MLRPEFELRIEKDAVILRDVARNEQWREDAPFSCEHLLIEDLQMFEFACRRLFEAARRGWYAFPKVIVSGTVQPLHQLEREGLQIALTNCGIHRIAFSSVVKVHSEREAERTSYKARVKTKP